MGERERERRNWPCLIDGNKLKREGKGREKWDGARVAATAKLIF